MYFKELFLFGIGTILGVVISSILINKCLVNYPFMTASFFIGLIIATIPMIISKLKETKITLLDIIIFILIITMMQLTIIMIYTMNTKPRLMSIMIK